LNAKQFVTAVGVIFVIVAAASTGADAAAEPAGLYVDPADGNDANPGSSERPWKTITWAESHAPNNSTVYLRSGNYGSVVLSRVTGRTSWSQGIFFEPDAGHTPTLTMLHFKYDSAASGDCYISFKGITVTGTSSDDKTIDIHEASHLRILNCTVRGWWNMTKKGVSVAGVRVRGSAKTMSDITVDGCDLQKAVKGIDISGKLGTGIVISNNHIHHCSDSGIGMESANSDNGLILVEHNHIEDQEILQDGKSSTHGSGIAVRCNNVKIARNIIHNYGNTRGIRLYQGVFHANGYNNITIENNLLYDLINDLAVELIDIGENCSFCNNTIIGYRGKSKQVSQRYGSALSLKRASSKNGSGFRMYNNILVGYLSINTGFTDYSENNNLIWAVSDWTMGGQWRGLLKGDKTIIFATKSRLLRQDIFATSGVFFAGGTAFDTYSYKRNGVGKPHGRNLDDAYKLAANSLAIGYGSKTCAPPNDLLGDLRGSRIDSGCYKYIPPSGSMQKPASP
jgi:hypothetical protein